MMNYEWLEPSITEEAAEMLSSREEAVVYAGGTDILPLMKHKLKAPRACISLRRIPRLQQIAFSDGGVRIGAMLTLAQLARNTKIARAFPALTGAARRTASPQIRNTGTVGGNILQERRCKYYNRSPRWRGGLPDCFLIGGDVCHQVPRSEYCRALYYSDLAPPLMVYGASLELCSVDGAREVPMDDFFGARGTKNITSGEVLTGIFIPWPQGESRSVFLKDSYRLSLDFPLFNVAANYSAQSAGKGERKHKFKIAVGAVAPAPMRLTQVEFQVDNGKGELDHGDIVQLAYDELARRHALISEVEINAAAKLQRAGGVLKKAISQVLP